MKYRFIQETKPNGKKLYYTQYLSTHNLWLFVDETMVFEDEAKARAIFNSLTPNPTPMIAVLDERTAT